MAPLRASLTWAFLLYLHANNRRKRNATSLHQCCLSLSLSLPLHLTIFSLFWNALRKPPLFLQGRRRSGYPEKFSRKVLMSERTAALWLFFSFLLLLFLYYRPVLRCLLFFSIFLVETCFQRNLFFPLKMLLRMRPSVSLFFPGHLPLQSTFLGADINHLRWAADFRGSASYTFALFTKHSDSTWRLRRTFSRVTYGSHKLGKNYEYTCLQMCYYNHVPFSWTPVIRTYNSIRMQ